MYWHFWGKKQDLFSINSSYIYPIFADMIIENFHCWKNKRKNATRIFVENPNGSIPTIWKEYDSTYEQRPLSLMSTMWITSLRPNKSSKPYLNSLWDLKSIFNNAPCSSIWKQMCKNKKHWKYNKKSLTEELKLFTPLNTNNFVILFFQ